jgi:hypothetical protein
MPLTKIIKFTATIFKLIPVSYFIQLVRTQGAGNMEGADLILTSIN